MRNGVAPDFFLISDMLYDIDNKHQFSFISKMIHTADTCSPIYDSRVQAAPDLPTVDPLHGKEDKIMESFNIWNSIRELYKELWLNEEFAGLLEEFDRIYHTYMSVIKKIDFIIWAYGTVLQNKNS